ncbi:MAG: hypothetical protein WAV76_06835 [Bacteroidota bacterium]
MQNKVKLLYPNVPLYGISRFLDSVPLHPKFRRAGFWKAEPYSGPLIGLPAAGVGSSSSGFLPTLSEWE